MADPIMEVASEAFDLLTELPTPRHAANAIAVMNTMLIEQAQNPEIHTEDQVRKMMGEMVEAVVANWKLRARRDA